MSTVHLHLDFETRSHLDIKKVGLDRYARNAEVLMLAWAINDEPPQLWVPSRVVPNSSTMDYIYTLLTKPGVVKVAWNCAFERAILRYCLGIESPIDQWLDPKVMAQYATLPAHLKGACEFLGLGDKAKHDGSRLITKFCKPRKGKFTQPSDAPEDWETFKEYCRQDVVAEREVLRVLQKGFSLSPFERKIWMIDSAVNERGAPVDMQFVTEAKKLVDTEKSKLAAELKQITGLANPNSNSQMLPWLRARGYPYSSLLKRRVDAALAEGVDAPVKHVLHLRGMLSRSSTAKLDALMERTIEGRLRHSYKYMGASRTGRWAGEGVQTQNLPR